MRQPSYSSAPSSSWVRRWFMRQDDWTLWCVFIIFAIVNFAFTVWLVTLILMIIRGIVT